jgi:hypothetical protein
MKHDTLYDVWTNEEPHFFSKIIYAVHIVYLKRDTVNLTYITDMECDSWQRRDPTVSWKRKLETARKHIQQTG